MLTELVLYMLNMLHSTLQTLGQVHSTASPTHEKEPPHMVPPENLLGLVIVHFWDQVSSFSYNVIWIFS